MTRKSTKKETMGYCDRDYENETYEQYEARLEKKQKSRKGRRIKR